MFGLDKVCSMKSRYKILIIALIISLIYFLPIITIDYIYANTNDFNPIIEIMCPFIVIPDDFEPYLVFFLVILKDPIKQLDMIEYSIMSVCYEIEHPYISVIEEDTLNSKGCPQFCPKEPDDIGARTGPLPIKRSVIGLDKDWTGPTPFGYVHNATLAECIENNMEYIDHPNKPGEKIVNLNTVEKCF